MNLFLSTYTSLLITACLSELFTTELQGKLRNIEGRMKYVVSKNYLSHDIILNIIV